jgi:ApaG protein
MYYGEDVRRFRDHLSSCERPWHNQFLQLMTDIDKFKDAVGQGVTATRGIRMSDTTTRGIRVQVRSEFIPDRSSPRDGSYLFQYHVRISNEGGEVTQLISREWIITSADGEVERVKGQGVVGEQPVLPPGGSFEYTSYCPLKAAVGSMQGSYQMVTTGGERFDAVIAPFTLAVPHALN